MVLSLLLLGMPLKEEACLRFFLGGGAIPKDWAPNQNTLVFQAGL